MREGVNSPLAALCGSKSTSAASGCSPIWEPASANGMRPLMNPSNKQILINGGNFLTTQQGKVRKYLFHSIHFYRIISRPLVRFLDRSKRCLRSGQIYTFDLFDILSHHFQIFVQFSIKFAELNKN